MGFLPRQKLSKRMLAMRSLGRRVTAPFQGVTVPLSVALIAGFLLCSVLPMAIVRQRGQQRAEAQIINESQIIIKRNIDHIKRALTSFLRESYVLGVVSEIAARDPELMHSRIGSEILWRALQTSPHFDVVYVVFEDGSQHVVSRIDLARRATKKRIPPQAIWQYYWEEPYQSGRQRLRRTQFYDQWRNPIGDLRVEPNSVDPRLQAPYRVVKQRRGMSLSSVRLNPETGSLVITAGWPIVSRNGYQGFVGTNVTLKSFSEYLRQQTVDPRSTIYLLDGHGRVAVSSADNKVLRLPGYIQSHLASWVDGTGGKSGQDALCGDSAARAKRRLLGECRQIGSAGRQAGAARQLALASGGRAALPASVKTTDRIDDNCIELDDRVGQLVSLRPDAGGDRLIVSRSCRFRIGPSDQWQLITVAREMDVVGPQRNNAWIAAREQLAVIAGVLVLILLFSWRITRNIERVSRGFARVSELRLDGPPVVASSHLRDVAMLQKGLQLLIDSMRTFARFVPDDIVRRLSSSGQGFVECVAAKEITIFFCDIAGFTSMAECQPLESTLSHLREYFNLVCREVNLEGGTVDKFIGDAVMAFWGAPDQLSDHALRAARAALKVQQALRAYNASPEHETEPNLNVRIGLHTATVLVGTIGSSDRLSYTAIGDGVNIASRLEGLNKELGTEICISDAMLEACGGRVRTRCLGPQRLRGRGTLLTVHELLGLEEPVTPGNAI